MDNKNFIDELSRRTGFDREKVSGLLEDFSGIISEAIGNEDSIMIPAFGTFEPRKKMERIVVHPLTGNKLLVPPKLSVVFKASSAMKNMLRRDWEQR
ncbi:MAG: HU family DNA-binding protein [Bacteroidales bacterium]|nr:HU family DNA-binding protein [Bacteroidales bacterium]